MERIMVASALGGGANRAKADRAGKAKGEQRAHRSFHAL
jgi:hypothetical protein